MAGYRLSCNEQCHRPPQRVVCRLMRVSAYFLNGVKSFLSLIRPYIQIKPIVPIDGSCSLVPPPVSAPVRDDGYEDGNLPVVCPGGNAVVVRNCLSTTRCLYVSITTPSMHTPVYPCKSVLYWYLACVLQQMSFSMTQCHDLSRWFGSRQVDANRRSIYTSLLRRVASLRS
jgi:hypothetical protein